MLTRKAIDDLLEALLADGCAESTEKWYQQRLGQLVQSLFGPVKETVTLHEAINEFLTSREAKWASETTYDLYSHNLQRFETYLYDRDQALIKIGAVTPFHINDYLSFLRRSRRFEGHPLIEPEGSLSPYTVHQHYRVLSTFFNWTVKVEMVADSPMSKVDKPKLPDEEMPVLGDEEVIKLIAAINLRRQNGLRNMAIVVLLLDTGLRRGEVARLTLRDVDFDQREVWVKRSKGGSNRIVPIQDAVELLQVYLEVRPLSGSPYLFVTGKGEPLAGESIRSMLRRLGKKAGVQHSNAHTFRHTFARNYLRRGGDVETLRRILGHKSIEYTRRYLNLLISDVKEKHQQVSPAGAFSDYLREKLEAVRK